MRRKEPAPLCIVIAGPNGAGKTTFAKEYLVKDVGLLHFVNADLIAGGLSPLRPELAALSAGRLFLKQIDQLAAARETFAFETTLSGRSHANRLRSWKAAGYRVEIIFLKLSSPALALRRVAGRVKQGGHDVPRADVLRRYERGWENFERIYRSLADAWAVYDNSGDSPLIGARVMSQKVTKAELDNFTATITKALRRAARSARKTASQFGMPIYVLRGGKVVAIKPKKS